MRRFETQGHTIEYIEGDLFLIDGNEFRTVYGVTGVLTHLLVSGSSDERVVELLSYMDAAVIDDSPFLRPKTAMGRVITKRL